MSTASATAGRPDLRADCGSCFALCCVALGFARSADFGFDKPAGEPCVNVQEDYRCGIHAELRPRGFAGCTVFDCHGAGQRVAQRTFGGRSWREDPATRASMFAVFPVMRQLHELLAHLDDAGRLAEGDPGLQSDVQAMADVVDRTGDLPPEELTAVDVDALRDRVAAVLRRVVAPVVARGSAARRRPLPNRVEPGGDLLGARLAGADLRGADLRGAVLIAADLSGADLGDAVLLGADLRDTDLSGADLSRAAFLTRPQVAAARGDARTRLPDGFDRPGHWA